MQKGFYQVDVFDIQRSLKVLKLAKKEHYLIKLLIVKHFWDNQRLRSSHKKIRPPRKIT
jgi:hypothetical protein